MKTMSRIYCTQNDNLYHHLHTPGCSFTEESKDANSRFAEWFHLSPVKVFEVLRRHCMAVGKWLHLLIAYGQGCFLYFVF